MNVKKIIFLVFSYILTGIILHACMETIQPEDTNKRLLKTAVFRMIDEATGELVPVRSAEVTIYEEVNGALNELKILQTNENGLAVFDLDIPVIGKLYTIKATYNNESQSKSAVLICGDTTVNFIFNDDINNISCSDLNQNDTLLFFDNEGSARLKRNTPANINQYERCKTYTIDNNNTGTIDIQLPSVPAPFTYISIYHTDKPMPVSTRKLTLLPGEKFTICFGVSTENAGIFNERIQFGITCSDGNSGTSSLDLKAEVVEPSCDCEDYSQSAKILLDERVMIGSSTNFKDIEVFVNNSACAVEIVKINQNLGAGWTITSPTFPVTVAKGASLKVSGTFAPTKSGKSNTVLQLLIKPQGTSNECNLNINLEAEGCYNTCPFIGMDNRFQLRLLGSPSPVGDTISNRGDGKVFISAVGLVSNAVQSYFIKNPDSACAEITINLELLPKDNYARTYFSVSPTRLTLLPGETGQIDVSFIAPTMDELIKILEVRRPGGPYQTIDSMFTTRLRIRGGNCTQDIDIDALVTSIPNISPIINLRAYNQSTTQKPLPENEVYYFGYGSRSIIKSSDGSNGPYPPPLGDIWIDVNNNAQSANPPQEPILKLIHGGIQMKLWKSNYQESKFSDVANLMAEFSNDPTYSLGYGPGPLTGLSVNDVYAFKFNEMTYALIFIRRVDNGTEATSSKQSGIEFRAIYPIYIF
jgi:hypothetical protein